MILDKNGILVTINYIILEEYWYYGKYKLCVENIIKIIRKRFNNKFKKYQKES